MAVPTWTTLIRRCLSRRIDVQAFGEVLKAFSDSKGSSSNVLTRILLDCRQDFCSDGDPLIALYIEEALVSGSLKLSEVLLVLIDRWNKSTKRSGEEQNNRGREDTDVQTVQELSNLVGAAKVAIDDQEARNSLLLLSKWLPPLVKWVSRVPGPANIASVTSMIESVGSLLASLCSTGTVMPILLSAEADRRQIATKSSSKDTSHEPRASVLKAVNMCIPLYPTISVQLLQRLNAVQKHYCLFDEASNHTSGSPNMHALQANAMQFQDDIEDARIVPSRIATSAYLRTMVCFTRVSFHVLVLTGKVRCRRNDRRQHCLQLPECSTYCETLSVA